MPATDFASLQLKPELFANLETLGYQHMTPIQALSLPPVLAGRDVIGQGKTGSGKTAAFGLGLLQKLDVQRFRIQTLVLCPTRELADQVAVEIRKLGRGLHNVKVLTLCGGAAIGPQIGSLEHGAHIIVGTPGRIDDHLRKGTLTLADVDTLVLDEADRMLEMGFQDSLEAIVAHVPATRQTLLFSATFAENIQRIARGMMRDPVMVEVQADDDISSIDQRFHKVDTGTDRFTALRLLLQDIRPESALVFCTTKRDVDDVCQQLQRHNFSALALHGDMEQRDRERTLILFSNNSVSVLVATDVAARGLDIEALDLVVNYHPARDTDTHVHRIGRTGRAGSQGLACTLFDDSDAHKIARLAVQGDPLKDPHPLPPLSLLDIKTPYPAMQTLQIDGGKKQKLRPGDIVGALTNGGDINFAQIGKINVTDNSAYVAVHHDIARLAQNKLGEGKLKGRSFRVRKL
ncbi:MAG: ATP-dependent RNA helicase DbpA [Gammaproteobacteria bacterium]|nr:ATP-dependent RNA helicase DbpA [Gammaproteobacteria bacterium]|tara:strand:- start:899 stop:2281 length:1383 start_codon:yes stop_codon:yes gene_type:complete